MHASTTSGRLPNLLMEGVQAYTLGHASAVSGMVSFLYIDIVGFSRFEQGYGMESCNRILAIASGVLLEQLAGHALPWPNAEALHVFDDGFVIFIPYAVSWEHHSRVIHEFVTNVEYIVNERAGLNGASSLQLRYGLSPSTRLDPENLSTQFYELIALAGRRARRHSGSVPPFIMTELHHVVQTNGIRIHYQPIVHLESQSIIGWESLARGPAGSGLERPVNLFDYAERAGYLLDVERLCRNQAIHSASVYPGTKLFINVSPNILSDPAFHHGETREVIDAAGLEPSQIVFEITEHHAIHDYSSFLQLVAHYRDQGYKIAIDDVGAGYSGLVTLMQVKPDFVKIDMELIRNIHLDRTKQDIVRAICHISNGFSGTVIAEGIETSEELDCIQACGVPCGQGFLLGRPGPETSFDVPFRTASGQRFAEQSRLRVSR
ncbi:EAL domain-containing protein [Alicyclobacillus cycloheptanicus]|uniref:EAL domain-containing protein (Putative c-di-GMP-specific phosphodiesterase class I) n=1 Tax=Alicyclobacillus cycloheptanicus TaxID=1457 RepID=A0ABT9XFP1_9BACL|nr:EAL domain-containing protein [Alicyclobacillus cycloheptanicus]MDQ0189116.1 EAL domain-containing protein (putative c-di-GMP-specific phosphodiesterase class I) [Alicyclobacillus cycloheptanicus]WDM00246.1 EAL domain-containing protein [Alicyclobacillus cycloheptanicus]